MQKRYLALLLLFWITPAHAQFGGGVTVQGAVTPNDCVKFVNGYVIQDAGTTCGGGGGGTPGGSNTQVQYNNSGSFGGTSLITIGTNSITQLGPISAQTKINLNSSALPSAQAGTILQFGNADTAASRIEGNAFGSTTFYTSIRYNGTNASPTGLVANDQIGGINGWGYTGSAVLGPQVSFREFSAGTWSSSSAPTYADITTTPIGTTAQAEVIRFENDAGITVPATVTGGDKGAGTINAAGLYVNGVAVTAGGSGTVNSGTANYAAYYATSTAAVSATPLIQYTSANAVQIGTSTTAITFAPFTANANGFIGVNTSGVASDVNSVAISGDISINSSGVATVTGIQGTAVSTPVGTGAVVLAASPTITTPTIATNEIVPLVIGTSGTTGALVLESAQGAGSGTGDYISFQTGSQSERMRILTGGTIGIGTTIPGTNGTLAINGGLIVGSYGGNATSGLSNGAIISGNVGIGTTTMRNSSQLDIQGGLNANSTINAANLSTSSAAQTGTLCWTTGTGNFTVDTTTTCLLSSLRFKKDIQDLDVGLSEIMKMHPVSFLYKESGGDANLKKRKVGLIAEEVDKIDPRLVAYEQDGKTPRSIMYAEYTAVLTKAIQDQQKEIVNLQKQITVLKMMKRKK